MEPWIALSITAYSLALVGAYLIWNRHSTKEPDNVIGQIFEKRKW